MLYKLKFGGGFIALAVKNLCCNSPAHDCRNEPRNPALPSPCGGVGDITFTPVDSLWTQHFHLITYGKCQVDLPALKAVDARSSLNEDDEEWKRIWVAPEGPFLYAVWHYAALQLTEALKAYA